MDLEAKRQGLARFERAWKEAAYLAGRNPPGLGLNDVRLEAANERAIAAEEISGVFNELEENPCHDCGRCCTKAVMDSGYWSHNEREILLARGDDPRDYLVEEWEGEPLYRCLFLSSTGCNLPVDMRSSLCLSYVCADRLAPAMATKEGLVRRYREARSDLAVANSRLNRSTSLDWPKEKTNDFGEG